MEMYESIRNPRGSIREKMEGNEACDRSSTHKSYGYRPKPASLQTRFGSSAQYECWSLGSNFNAKVAGCISRSTSLLTEH